jgi:putative phosphoribosyl transferase
VPGNEELAMGAIASGGVSLLDEELIRELEISAELVDQVAERETAELKRRERVYRSGRPAPSLRGRHVVLVDDGLATGFSMRAAVEALRRSGVERVVVGVPVGAPETCQQLSRIADQVVCATMPEPFRAVGLWYADFSQTEDQEVHDLLDAAADTALGTDPEVVAQERRLGAPSSPRSAASRRRGVAL